MPFEVFDSADDHDDLPEPLAALAEQLRSDAQRVAEQYPLRDEVAARVFAAARETPAAPRMLAESAPAGPRSYGRRWIAVAVVFVSAGLLISGVSRWGVGGFGDRGGRAPSARVAGNAHETVDREIVAAVATEAQPIDESGFEELSGPAQEAILDLFEENALTQTSLSI